jgi:hypothetical protein
MPYLLRDIHGREYPIHGPTRIGREATNAIVLDEAQASRLHATVWEEQGVLYLRDENSRNGTFVSGTRVQEVALKLNPGDQIRIGSTVLVVAQARGSQPAPASATVITPAPAAAATPSAAAKPAKKSGGGCAGWLVAGCLVALLGCGALGVGGFLAYRGGLITPNMLLNLVGLGPADIEVDNFRDDTIEIHILQLEVKTDETPTENYLEIEAFDIRTSRVQQPGRYQVNFGTTSGAADLGTCTLTLRSGDLYQFVALPDKIVVNRVNKPPDNGRDLIVETSTLCR